MSYEGYEQCLCKAGHLTTRDCMWHYDDAAGDGACPICREPIVWVNSVDETNYNSVGIIPDDEWEKFLSTPEETKRCDLGHLHMVAEATYRIPTDEEKEMMRHCKTSLVNPKTDPSVRPDGLVRMATFDWKGARKKYEDVRRREQKQLARINKKHR